MRRLFALLAAALIMPSMASSQEIYIGRDGVQYDHQPRGYYEAPRYDDNRRSRGCDPDLAMDFAQERGIRRGRIVNFSSNSIAIDGWTRRGPMRAEFYNRRGCPIIRTFYLDR